MYCDFKKKFSTSYFFELPLNALILNESELRPWSLKINLELRGPSEVPCSSNEYLVEKSFLEAQYILPALVHFLCQGYEKILIQIIIDDYLITLKLTLSSLAVCCLVRLSMCLYVRA